MSALARTGIGAAHRVRVLRALGLTPWVLRAKGEPPVPRDEAKVAPVPTADAASACVLILPQEVSAAEADVLARALAAIGAAFAHARRVNVRDGELAEVPIAMAYLVFGEPQAHALGRALDAAALQRAQIVLVDAPSALLTDASAKRRLWTALRRLRRGMAAAD